MSSYFVTGTDTNAGKTIITTALVKLLRSRSMNVVPFKPVQTGGIADTEFSLKNNSIFSDPKEFYSYSFKTACSPHLASELENVQISIEKIVEDFNVLVAKYENVIVEGAGGVMVPLGNGLYILDLIIKLDLPVILVVANKLGAINQALLTIDKLDSVGCAPELLVFNDLGIEEEEILTNNVKAVMAVSGIRSVRIPFMLNLNFDKVVQILGDSFGY
ncbi:MAG: dethiobiotin synthase [Candidatus Margulisbacteria bacterium]|nr:dethiobiotin synthase [Candidatus Margulisiibacteriota bacterium]